ncbi:MAG TPA: sugar phosphate isomerase/epimerase family protein [Armatimonadota bacterium]|nr:sugar phosphate isomerase/epimerase family protein [Armatimonadota bacterium]
MGPQLGISTDNWRLENKSLRFCVGRVAELGSKWIEFDVITGLDFFEGQQFSPSVSLESDPYVLKDLIDEHGLRCSCLSAHWPIWSYQCIDYMIKAIRFARVLGCSAIATTDSEHIPDTYSLDEWMGVYKYHFDCVVPSAERHGVYVCVEPHGVLTQRPDSLLRIVTQTRSPMMGVNFDTGNTFIAGHNPPDFLRQVIDHVHHMHIKEVSHELAAALRGESTGIAASSAAIGEGANAEGIRQCVRMLKEHGKNVVCSLEVSGDAPTERSVPWFRRVLEEA